MIKIKTMAQTLALLLGLSGFSLSVYAQDTCYAGFNQEVNASNCPDYYNKDIVNNAGQGYDNFLNVLNNGETIKFFNNQVKVPAIPNYNPKDTDASSPFRGRTGNITPPQRNQPAIPQQQPAVRVIEQPAANDEQSGDKYQYQVNPASNPPPQIPIQYR